MLWLLLATLWVVPPEVHPLAAAVAASLLAGAFILHITSGWRPGPGARAFVAVAALPVGLSHLLAVDRGAATERLVLLAGAGAIFLVARGLDGAAARRTLVLLAVAAGALTLHGVWQYAIGLDRLLDAAPPPEVAERLRTYRVFSRFLLPSAFASFLLLTLPVLGALARQGRGVRRLLPACGLLVGGIALLLTRSHGALVALIAGAVLWMALAPHRRRLRQVAVAVALIAAGLLTAVAVSRDGVLAADAAAAGPAALRWRNWSAAARMTIDHPVAGVGGGGFGSAYTRYRRPGDNETRFVHNVYLQLVAEHGVPFVVPLMLVVAGCGRRIRWAVHSGAPLERAAAFGLTAFLLHGVWDVAALLPSTLWTAAAVLGLLARSPLSRIAPAEDPAGRAIPSRPPALAAGTVALLTAFAVGLAAVGVRHGVAASLRTAAVEAAGPGGDSGVALDLARRAERWAPWQAENPLLVAETLLVRSSRDDEAAATEAAAAATRALARNRSWPAAHRVRALASARPGDAAAAAADLERAALLYPLSEVYRRELDALRETVSRAREERR